MRYQFNPVAMATALEPRTWTPQEILLRPDAEDRPETEFYLMKVFAYGRGYLGLIMKYYGDPNAPNKHSALLEYELVTSEDAVHWQRPFRKTDLGFWSYADPFLHQGRLHFVIWKDGGMQTVSYAPNRMTAAVAEEEGTFTTAPFAWPKGGLALDANISGWLEAELLDADGAIVPGVPVTRFDGVDGPELALLWGPSILGTYRMRFRMHNARLYALTANPAQSAVSGAVRLFNNAMMRTRSFENQCFIAITHPKQRLFGDPDGKVVVNEERERPGLTISVLDLDEASDDNDVQDRRPDLYGVIAQ